MVAITTAEPDTISESEDDRPHGDVAAGQKLERFAYRRGVDLHAAPSEEGPGRPPQRPAGITSPM